MVPLSDVCWFRNPINYSYIYHKPSHKKGKLQSLPAACVTFDGKTGNGHPKTAVKTATMWSPREIENAKLGFT